MSNLAYIIIYINTCDNVLYKVNVLLKQNDECVSESVGKEKAKFGCELVASRDKATRWEPSHVRRLYAYSVYAM